MKILIVFYTRTNTTKKVAEIMKLEMGLKGHSVDSEQLIDLTSRTGGIGYVRSGRGVIFKRQARIAPTQHNPADYDLVVIGTPVWAGTMTPAIKNYLDQNKRILENVAFFTTQGDTKRQRVFDDMKLISGLTPLRELQLTTQKVIKNEFRQELSKFIDEITSEE